MFCPIIENIEKHPNFEGKYMNSLHTCKELRDQCKLKTFCHDICKNNCYQKQMKYFEQYCCFIRNPEALYVERASDSSIAYILPAKMNSRYKAHTEF